MDASLNDIIYVYSEVFLKDRLKNVVIKVLFTEIMSIQNIEGNFIVLASCLLCKSVIAILTST